MTLWAVAAMLYAGAVLAAWALVRRRPDHRPIALLLSVGFASDVVREAIGAYVLRPTRAATGGAPFTGLVRALFHVDEALFLAWPAALASCAVWVYLRRRPWPVAAVYALAVVACASAYPTLRGAALGRAYFGAQLAALVVALGTFVTWAWKREAPDLTRGVMLVITAVELVVLLPYSKGPFTYWPLAQVAYVVLYVVLILFYGGLSWGRGSSSSSNSR